MTTLRELGEMLIEVADNGREMQCRQYQNAIPSIWETVCVKTGAFSLGHYEYRLKPKVTYYRVYKDASRYAKVFEQDYPFSAGKPWIEVYPDWTHIHDFEVES